MERWRWSWRPSNWCPHRLVQRLTASRPLITPLVTGNGGSISIVLTAGTASSPFIVTRPKLLRAKIFFIWKKLLLLLAPERPTFSLLMWPMQPTLGDAGTSVFKALTWLWQIKRVFSLHFLTIPFLEGLEQNMGVKLMMDSWPLPMLLDGWSSFWFLGVRRPWERGREGEI